jgi:hypothetical protein
MTQPEVIAGILECKNFARPDEVRSFPKGRIELLNIGGGVVGRIELEPGWRWSQHVKPTAGTELCEASHFQYIISGRLHGVLSDGTEFEAGPGDVLALGPGHEAWVIGDERFVAVDWTGASEYAKRSE